MMKKVLIGFIAGFISGLFSTGGGMILVPAFIHFFNIEDKKARATSIICILAMVLTTSFFYFKKGYLDFYIGIQCIIGGIIGGFIGTKLLYKISENILKILYIVFIIYGSCKFIFS